MKLSVKEILDLLENVSPRNGYYMASCPAHDDRTASLSIAEGEEGRILLNCFGGCSFDEIIAVLTKRTAGREEDPKEARTACRAVQDSEFTGPRSWPSFGKVANFGSPDEAIERLSRQLGPPTAMYDYTDASGTVVGKTLRFAKKGGGKEVRPISLDRGGWALKAMPFPRPLYRLSELSGASRLYVVEGEKCVEALRSIEMVATTSPGGSSAAARADWSPLAGKECVVICPDNDPAGEMYANKVIELLRKLPSPPALKVLDFPDLEKGGDIADFIDSLKEMGNSVLQIREIIEARPAREIKKPSKPPGTGGVQLLSFDEIETEEIDWLWEGRLARGLLTLLAGDPDQGKSFLTAEIAARVSSGTGWPDVSKSGLSPGDVIMLSPEDGAAYTIKPRLKAAGADMRRVHMIALPGAEPDSEALVNPAISLDSQFDLLEEAISKVKDPKLLIIDPISAFMGKINPYKDTEVREVLNKLQTLASQHQMGILMVIHLNKDVASSKRVLQRVMGSMAFVAAVRLAFLLAPHPERKGLRVLLNAKNNLGVRTPALGFRFVEPKGPESTRIEWLSEPISLTADEALEAMNPQNRGRAKELDRACDFLETKLCEGEAPQKEIMENADRENISERTLRRAAKELGIEKSKDGFQGASIWSLPAAEKKMGGSPESLEEAS